MKKTFIVVICMCMVLAGYLAFTTVDKGATVATAAGKTYVGTVYVAGNGGHFSVAEVLIDPSADAPIKVTKDLGMISLGTSKTHPVHDPRIDPTDRTKMYWSTYKPDANDKTVVHIGVADLKTNSVVKDVSVKIDDRAKWTGAMYCASGQTKDLFMPITMSGEGYIDIFNKSDMSLSKRVFLDSLGYKENYWFIHGTNSPDYKTFVLAINQTEQWVDSKTPGKLNGKVDIILLDLPELVKGNLKVLKKVTLSGEAGKTITFRQYFTTDGKKILQSAADRLWVLNAKTLELEKELTNLPGENHDAMNTPDDKYAILTLRSPVISDEDPEAKKTIKDGTLALYDIAAKKLVGKTTSVCYACHRTMGMHKDAPLCGIDGNLK